MKNQERTATSVNSDLEIIQAVHLMQSHQEAIKETTNKRVIEYSNGIIAELEKNLKAFNPNYMVVYNEFKASVLS